MLTYDVIKFLKNKTFITQANKKIHHQLTSADPNPFLTGRTIYPPAFLQLTCQTQSRNNRNTGDSCRSFETAKDDFKHRSANG